MKVGELVHDNIMGMVGIIIAGPNIEVGDGSYYPAGDILSWDWRIFYNNGAITGANTRDLEVINESR